MPKELLMDEKIEVRMHAGLKRAVEAAALQDGDGNVGAWVRALLRSKVRELGIEDAPTARAAAEPSASYGAKRGKRKGGAR